MEAKAHVVFLLYPRGDLSNVHTDRSRMPREKRENIQRGNIYFLYILT